MFKLEKSRGYLHKCQRCGKMGMRMMLKIQSSYYSDPAWAQNNPNPDIYVHADCFMDALVTAE